LRKIFEVKGKKDREDLNAKMIYKDCKVDWLGVWGGGSDRSGGYGIFPWTKNTSLLNQKNGLPRLIAMAIGRDRRVVGSNPDNPPGNP